MFKKSLTLFVACIAFAACGDNQPRVIQVSANSPQINLTVGLATQIEMPGESHVTGITVGNPALISADAAGDVVNLTAKTDAGATNLIIRARDDSGNTKVYQYHVTVQKP